jgi:hypothetical protein
MKLHPSRRNTGLLWGLLALAVIYGGVLRFLPGVFSNRLLGGFIGVALGLYICSCPAANAVDLLFLERRGGRPFASVWAGAGWLTLNLLVLLAGFAVILLGTRQLAAAPH